MYTPYNQLPTMQYGIGQQPPMIGSIGGMGYNSIGGGYYTNNYNMYNPYLLRQQQEEYEKQQQQLRQQQYNISCMLHRAANSFYGEEYIPPSTEEQNEYYYYAQLELQKIAQYEHLAQLSANLDSIVEQQQQAYRDSIRYNITVEEQEKHQNDTLLEFLDTAGELYAKALENEFNANNQEKYNLKHLYNHDSYNRLVNMHNNSRFNAYKQDFNIDDMEVSLPAKLNNEYQQRKQAFLNQILNKGGFGNG